MANLAQILNVAAERGPYRTALRDDGVAVSYAALEQAAGQVAYLLHASGVVPGDRVALMLPNVSHFASCYYGALRAGAAVVPINPLFKRREVSFVLRDAAVKTVFAWSAAMDVARSAAEEAGVSLVVVEPGAFEELLECVDPVDLVGRASDETAVILYTSATTGRPKGAQLTHRNLSRNLEASQRLLELDESAVTVGVLPLSRSFGQTCVLNATLAAGGCVTLLQRFDAVATFELIERDRATVFQGVPTMYASLLGHPDRDRFDTSSLRTWVSGGASMPLELLHAFESHFGCSILEGYGLSETSPVASFNRCDRPRKAGSIGVPIDGVQMRVVDQSGATLPAGETGEIVIRGHNVMKGYWRRPQATAEVLAADGWFRTGDLAHVDDDGYFFIVDRREDLIIRGGFNIYPREIEAVLHEHPDVREAAVLGFPHARLGQEIAAAVVAQPSSHIHGDALQAFVKARLAPYKYPRLLWFVDELPKGPAGNVLKRKLELPMPLETAGR